MSREADREREREREVREEMQVSTHPSAQFRVGLGRAGLGLGCAINTYCSSTCRFYCGNSTVLT